MFKKIISRVICFTAAVVTTFANGGQPDASNCGTDNAMKQFRLYHPNEGQKTVGKKTAGQKGFSRLINNPIYRIPVVFHVYGSTFNGREVTYEIIEDALRMVNEDFQGLTADWNEIVPEFDGIKQALDIEFMLAKRDPDGNPTTGVDWHPVKWGYGNWGHNSQVAADAWDNKKYMNVYIQNDLYGDGYPYNSGVAWYPYLSMTNANTARVVYNGAYLGNNTGVNFRSVLTHEFGHWLNLAHTFSGGCSAANEAYCDSSGDYICDTPQVDHSGIDSAGELNCLGQETNWQNFMAYSSQYAMFTQDQVDGMIDALYFQARYSLWQAGNLAATGVLEPASPAVTISSSLEEERQSDNGTIVGNAKIRLTEGATFTNTGEWVEGVDYTLAGLPEGLTVTITSQSDTYAVLTVTGRIGDDDDDDDDDGNNHTAADSFDLTLTLLDAAVAGGVGSLMNPVNDIHVPLSELHGLKANKNKDGVANNVAASDKENIWFYVDVKSPASKMTITAIADNGDADLFIKYESLPFEYFYSDEYECGSVNWYSDEECVINNPPVGRWYILVHAWEAYENLTLRVDIDKDSDPHGVKLMSAAPITISQPDYKVQDRFYVKVPEDATELTFTLMGGNGDADIYSRFGKGATTSVWDCVSWNYGAVNNETCTHTNPQEGRWHVMVYSWEPYSDAVLTATVTVVDDDDDDD